MIQKLPTFEFLEPKGHIKQITVRHVYSHPYPRRTFLGKRRYFSANAVNLQAKRR